MGEVISQKGDVTYNALIEFMEENICRCWGDVLEIGAFCGHFTRRLAEWFDDCSVFAIDVFEPEHDKTIGKLYKQWLNGENQFEEYRRNIAGLNNVITVVCDSKNLHHHLWFVDGLKAVYIDGGHDYETVKMDFEFAWNNLEVGGVIVLDDYKHNLPDVTRAIDDSIERLKSIGRACGSTIKVWHLQELTAMAVRKDPV